MNNETHIGIVGAGRIGTAIYELLVSSNTSYRISIADEAEKNFPDFVKLPVTKPTYDGEVVQFKEFVQNKTLIINALPYTQNISLFKSCYDFDVPYFDLSEDEALDNYIKELQSIPFTMPHCGLAPGMSTVIANDLITGLDELQEVKIRVGALSQNATNKLKYHSSWSGDGLVNEYLGDCQVVQKGQFGTVPALSGYEKLTLDGKEYEAFHTSGGIGTFADTLSGLYPYVNANYKTLRRIGHHDYVDFLFNDLNIPQAELTSMFKKHIPKTRKDLVILYASVGGNIKDECVEKTYYKVFKPERINGRHMTAIEYTTAVGMLAMVELYINGKLPSDGYVRQESVKLKDVFTTTFGNFYREDM
jgi:saccharopine dehydrogenase-like NADP-dependent oxidoreductase